MRQRPPRRVGSRIAAVVAAPVALLAALAAPAGSLPGATSSCPPPAPGTVRVAVVVDHGDGRSVDTACVVLDDASPTGLDALAAYAATRGGLRFHGSGLLCAIGGNPATGCGEVVGDDYLYWSYWTGDGGSWSYASFGPTRRVGDGAVEGWRFQAGAGNATDPPPRAAAPSVAFPTPAPTTAPPTTRPTTAPPPPPTTAAPIATNPRPSTSPGGEPSAATGGSGAAPSTAATAGDVPTTGPVDDATTTTAPGDPEGDDASGTEDAAGSVGGTEPAGDATSFEVIDAGEVAASADGAGGDGGAPIGALVGAGTVLVLGGAAALRWRQGAG